MVSRSLNRKKKTAAPLETKTNRAVDCGCWFSVGPAMLAGERGRELAWRMPCERVLTETDGPFTQSNGRPLFPWDVGAAEKTLANSWRKDLDETRRILRGNPSHLVEQTSRVNKTEMTD